MPNGKIPLVLLDCIALNQRKSTNFIKLLYFQNHPKRNQVHFPKMTWRNLFKIKCCRKLQSPLPPSLAIFWSRALDSVTNILCPARAIALKISSCHKTDNNNTISEIAQHSQSQHQIRILRPDSQIGNNVCTYLFRPGDVEH